jgi:multicomponent Na+:H+ antiporter subunit A
MSEPSALVVLVVAPFAAAFVSLSLGRVLGRFAALPMIAAAFVSFAAALGETSAGITVFALDWIPSLGVTFRLRADGFGTFFSLLVSGIGFLVGVYAFGYLPDLPRARLGRFYAALAAFMGAMLGIVLADDLILLFVFWELTSVTSFVLIGFWYEEEKARHGALTALLVTSLGGLAMLAGFVLVGLSAGTFAVSEIVASPERLAALTTSPTFVAALTLVLAGAFTKSAQVPFHFWLPGAMVAPTPVSAYLHAATMVKAGIFLIGRVAPLFAASVWWSSLLVPFGLATFVFGAWQSFRETDLKALLAYTTVSSLGLVTLVYGLGAADQDALQILSHAAYKGALFLVAGIVEHATGSRDVRKLGGLRHELPITFWICVVGVLSMGGVPPFLGFAAKESLYEALLQSEALGGAALRATVVAGVVLANAFLLASGLKLLVGAFLGERRAFDHESGHEGEHHGENALLWLPPGVLALSSLALGLLAATPVTGHLVSAFSSDPRSHLHVALVPAHVGPFALSLVTLALGFAIHRLAATVEAFQARLDRPTTAQETWDRLVAGVTSFAEGYSSRWQNGSLRWYLSAILVFFAGLALFALESRGLSIQSAEVDFRNLTWPGLALAALMIFATFAVVRSDTRLGAALALTSSGFLVALMYAIYRSPDILLTQILIETVSTIFLLLVLYFMPPFRKDGLSPFQTASNAMVSGAVGLVTFLFVLFSTSPAFRETNNIARDYLARSLSEAGGRNAVNVIIVDFRAMDTQGEVTVLVVVGLSVYGLLRARRRTS